MGMTSKFSDVKEQSPAQDGKLELDAQVCDDVQRIEAVTSTCISTTESICKDENRNSSPLPSLSTSSLAVGLKKPSEVFRTDFIAGMKVSESQSLPTGNYLDLKDTWRTEWEKGVQVPVNPHMLPQVQFRMKETTEHVNKRRQSFQLPESRITFENPIDAVIRDQTGISSNYDLDEIDAEWIKGCAELKHRKNEIDEITMERAVTYFERKCFENMVHAVTTKEGLSIEYDESTICDVCLSPDTEEGNEIVFCDACNMCAHQVCYGLLEIPHGNWLCRPCSRGILSPPCVLCPNKGGALKRVKDSYDWVHVICSWWIPEVKIEDTDNIENITVNKIPQSRWNLTCSLCWDKMGACVQCSVKRCVRAYHITCAVKEGLEMKTVVIPEKDDVQHISYCNKHCIPQPSGEKKTKGEIAENQRLDELKKLETEFYKLVTIKQAARDLHLSKEAIRKLYCFWTLKRKANDNVPLIPLTAEQKEQLSGKQGIIFIHEQMNMEAARFTILRQDLERLRNLCYMIVRRERARRELHRSSFDIFYKQHDILTKEKVSTKEYQWVTRGDEYMRFVGFPNYTTKAEQEHLTGSSDSQQSATDVSAEEDTELNRFQRLLESGRYDVPKSLSLLNLDGFSVERSTSCAFLDTTVHPKPGLATETAKGANTVILGANTVAPGAEVAEKKKKRRRRANRYSYDPPKKKKKPVKRYSELPLNLSETICEISPKLEQSGDSLNGPESSTGSAADTILKKDTAADTIPNKDTAAEDTEAEVCQLKENDQENDLAEGVTKDAEMLSRNVTELDSDAVEATTSVPKEEAEVLEEKPSVKTDSISVEVAEELINNTELSTDSTNNSSLAALEKDTKEGLGTNAKVLQDSENIPKSGYSDSVRNKWASCQTNGDVSRMDLTTESENVNFERQKSLESGDKHNSPTRKDGQVRRNPKSPHRATRFSNMHNYRRLSPRLNKFTTTTFDDTETQQIIDKLKTETNHVITVEDYEKPQRMTRSRHSLLKELDRTTRS